MIAQYMTITDPDRLEYTNFDDVSQNCHGDYFSCCAFGTKLMYRLWTQRDNLESSLDKIMDATTRLDQGNIYFFHIETNEEMHFFVIYYPVCGNPLYLATYGGNKEFYIKLIDIQDIYNLWNPQLAPETYINLFDIPPECQDLAYYKELSVRYGQIPLRQLELDDVFELLIELYQKAQHSNNKKELQYLICKVLKNSNPNHS